MQPFETSLNEVTGRIPVWHPLAEGIAALEVGTEAPRFIELKRGAAPKVLTDSATGAQCTLRMSLDVWKALVSGQLSPNAALLQHKLEVEGDVTLAQSFARAALR